MQVPSHASCSEDTEQCSSTAFVHARGHSRVSNSIFSRLFSSFVQQMLLDGQGTCRETCAPTSFVSAPQHQRLTQLWLACMCGPCHIASTTATSVCAATSRVNTHPLDLEAHLDCCYALCLANKVEAIRRDSTAVLLAHAVGKASQSCSWLRVIWSRGRPVRLDGIRWEVSVFRAA